MRSTKVFLCVTAALLLGTVTANAGFFDTLKTVADTADTVAQTNKQLSEGKLPTAALKGVGGGKHGSKGHHKK